MTDQEHTALLGAFPRERTWLLPALQAVQHAVGWIPPEALLAVAQHLRVPRSEVYGVASHYPEFRLEQPGRRVVRVCTGVSCRVVGAMNVLGALEAAAGIRAGGTTPDGAITLEALDCAFACGVAPVAEVEGRRVGRVTPADARRLLGGPVPLDAPGPRTMAPAPPPAAGAGAVLARFGELQVSARRGAPTRPRLLVAVGSCTLGTGAVETLSALTAEAARQTVAIDLGVTGCTGACWAAPAVTLIAADGLIRFLGRVLPGGAADLVRAAAAGRSLPDDPGLDGFIRGQRREITGRCGVVDPDDIGDAIRRGSYAVLARTLAEGRPERVVEEVKAARLQGRGGAYFPAAVKWEGARAAAGTVRYLIVNGEEGEPGTFKDRHLMEGDPHRLLEGALLAAHAAGVGRVVLYVHGEADLSAARLARALEEARRWGLIGERVLGSGFSVEVELRRGAGGFVLGEETALMESIEGRRAMPRAKPPFPVEAGLWGRPTVINNVETLFAVPLILERGAGWWTALGRGHGTKCFGLAGEVRRPGMVEMEMGVTLRELVGGLAGGIPGGHALKAVVLGGPSGSVIGPGQLDEPLVPGGPVNPGTGGIAALGPSASVRDAVRTLLDFNTRESCGKCTPCREGTARLRDALEGLAPVPPDGVPALCEVLRVASLCGLGQAAPLSLLSALREFPDEFGSPESERVS